MDPSSPLCDAAADRLQGSIRRRLRLRHRSRSPRHRHAAARACCRPITTSRSPSTTCSAIGPTGAPTPRSARRSSAAAMIDRVTPQARAPAVRGAGRLQVVRRRPVRRHARVRRRGKRGRVVPAPRRHRVDHRQGRHRAALLVGGDHRAHAAAIPAKLYRELGREFGAAVLRPRSTRPPTPEQKTALCASCQPTQVTATELAGEPIESILDEGAGQRRPIGGIKVIAAGGWFAARPSGTEDIYKIYAESFRGAAHLQQILRRCTDASSTPRWRPLQRLGRSDACRGPAGLYFQPPEAPV